MEILNDLPVYLLLDIAKTFNLNECTKHYRQHKNKLYVIDKLTHVYASGKNEEKKKIERMICDYVEGVYVFDFGTLRYWYENGGLSIMNEVLFEKGKKECSYVGYYTVDRNGGVLLTKTEMDGVQTGHQRLISFYIEREWSEFLEPLEHQEKVNDFLALLSHYWKHKQHDYVYISSEKTEYGSLKVFVELKGHENFRFEVIYNPKTNEITCVSVPEIGSGSFFNILDENELTTFITEVAPSRLSILF